MNEDGYLYVDKMRQIADKIQAGKYLFLSRPRRFGKFCTPFDTLRQAQGPSSVHSKL
jgi:hypothetical protein